MARFLDGLSPRRTGAFALAALAVLGIAGTRSARPAPQPPPVAAAEAAAIEVGTTTALTSAAQVTPLDAPPPTAATPLRSTSAGAPATPPPLPPEVRAAASAPVTTEGTRSRAVTAGSAAAARVALTFDAGADAGYAAAILDMLEAAGVRASFGVTGQWAEANPALVRRIAAGGHQLINHTYDHGSFTGFSTNGRAQTREQRWAQLDRTEAILQSIAGVGASPYFRPPYGDLDASVLEDVGARGYAVTAMWAVDSLGWNGLPPGQIVERTLRQAAPGAILIFHVGAASADAVALPAILTGLRERGYAFVTVAGLLAP